MLDHLETYVENKLPSHTPTGNKVLFIKTIFGLLTYFTFYVFFFRIEIGENNRSFHVFSWILYCFSLRHDDEEGINVSVQYLSLQSGDLILLIRRFAMIVSYLNGEAKSSFCFQDVAIP